MSSLLFRRLTLGRRGRALGAGGRLGLSRLLPVERVVVLDAALLHAALEDAVEQRVVWLVPVVEGLDMVEELSKVRRHVFEQGTVVVLFLHHPDLDVINHN